MRRRARATAAIGLAVVLMFLGIQLEDARHASAILELKSTYELVGADGGVFAFGGATFSGSLGDQHARHKIVAVLGPGANRGSYGPGYLLVDDAGIVYPFGLRSLGDLRGVALQAPIVGASEVAGGYLLVAADGGVFAFGDAKFHGSLVPSHLDAPIVGIAPGSGGYRLVDRNGRVYGLGAGSFGDLASTFSGSPGCRHRPVVTSHLLSRRIPTRNRERQGLRVRNSAIQRGCREFRSARAGRRHHCVGRRLLPVC